MPELHSEPSECITHRYQLIRPFLAWYSCPCGKCDDLVRQMKINMRALFLMTPDPRCVSVATLRLIDGGLHLEATYIASREMFCESCHAAIWEKSTRKHIAEHYGLSLEKN